MTQTLIEVIASLKAKGAEAMSNSQIHEELCELHDKKTKDIVQISRKGKGPRSIPFDRWEKSR